MTLLRFLFILLLVLALPPVRAQTPVTLFDSFAGNVNFAGTQRTIRKGSNQNDPCSVEKPNTTVSATLTGIPANSTILSAHLYWAGSGTAADYTVRFNGSDVTAPTSRRYAVTANGRSYFSGAVDVTSRVSGNGTYTFSRLTVDTTGGFCQVEGVTGGFALLVVYRSSTEPYRVLNLYEGFQPTYYSIFDLTLSNFRIPNPLGTATGRIGHITWEGDSTLGNTNAENLLFNGVEQFDASSPRWNQFNSSSNINNDNRSYGIDFDAYTISSPVIQAGQTSATTRYQSGQDLVLLSAEVIAVPNVPVSDLAITMTVANASMVRNVANAYRITVANNGPTAEPGPIVVTDTIDSDLTINSVSGTGWSCTVSGQQVTCSRNGPIASGTTLPMITISVTPNVVPSIITNTAAVLGTNFDNDELNSTASVTTGGSAAGYVFTDAPCVHNVSFSSASQTCRIYDFGTILAGTQLNDIYITAVNASGVPRRLSTGNSTTVYFYFGLSCINPTTTGGIAPTFTARAGMLTCASNGSTPLAGSRNSAVVFAGGSPSSYYSYSFVYHDVGMVELYMIDSDNSAGSSGSFVSKPALITLSNIAQASPAVSNPAATTPTGPKFVRAGDPFSMTVSARSLNNAVTPNFGRETIKEAFTVTMAGATDPTTGLVFSEMQNIPTLAGTWGPITAGSASGSAFSWAEVGILRLTPGILGNDYLGRGSVSGTAVNVGRFYPDHFDTVTQSETGVLPAWGAPLPSCPANMACPDDAGAAYSGQPFRVEVTARNAGNAVTRNYDGRFARDVTLEAWNANGGTGMRNPPASASVLANASVGASAFADGVATVPAATYTFPTGFDYALPRATGNWIAPTTIYLRAFESADTSVTSLQGGASEEGPMHIVSGRLFVSNAYGSDLINMPVQVRAQYWTGTGWENSTTDNTSVLTPAAASLAFSGCTGGLAGACTAPLTPVFTTPFVLADGLGTVRLRAPGGGNGSTLMRMIAPGAPAWLPSSAGKLTFGVKKAPVDYIREVY